MIARLLRVLGLSVVALVTLVPIVSAVLMAAQRRSDRLAAREAYEWESLVDTYPKTLGSGWRSEWSVLRRSLPFWSLMLSCVAFTVAYGGFVGWW